MGQLVTRWAIPRRLAILLSLAGISALILSSINGYVVREGDTLSSIAARHGVTVEQLVAANRIADPDHILVGQELELPNSAGREADQSSERAHKVRRGETLTSIAAHYGVSVADLVSANHLDEADKVPAGRRLIIPGTGGVPAAPAPVERSEAEKIMESTALAYGWNPAIVKALAWQESGWQQTVVSRTGAVGIMQVQPGTGEFVSRYLVGRKLDLTDPQDNVVAGVAFLDYLYGLTGKDVRLTLGSYYQGLGSIRARGWFPDTVRYVDNVLALRARFA